VPDAARGGVTTRRGVKARGGPTTRAAEAETSPQTPRHPRESEDLRGWALGWERESPLRGESVGGGDRLIVVHELPVIVVIGGVYPSREPFICVKQFRTHVDQVEATHDEKSTHFSCCLVATSIASN
jgi:hypothetical protein